MLDVIDALRAALAAQSPCATVTITQVTGSIPNEIGAKMLVGAGVQPVISPVLRY